MKVLRSALPDTNLDDVDMSVKEGVAEEDIEEVKMIDSNERDFGRVASAARGGSAYDSDDEEDGQPKVQCQHQ